MGLMLDIVRGPFFAPFLSPRCGPLLFHGIDLLLCAEDIN
jgi:hypothetical protein